MARHEMQAVQAMRFPPVPRPGTIATRMCVLCLAIAALAASSKVFVDVLRYPTQVQNAREALLRTDTLDEEIVDGVVVLQRNVIASIEALKAAASRSGIGADSARAAMTNITKTVR